MRVLPKWIQNFLLSALQDVLISSPTLGQHLEYDGTKWANTGLVTAGITANHTITNEDFVRGSGTNTIQVTLPNATTNVKPRTIKHIGTQDLTIVTVSSQQIDGDTSLILRGGKKNAVTLYSEGGHWWIT